MPSTVETRKRILIINLGPLGNWVMATGAFRDIRANYPQATIYLLTRSDFYEMAKEQGCFDHILTTQWTGPSFKQLHLKYIMESLFFRRIWRHRILSLKLDTIFDLHASRNVKRLYEGLESKMDIFPKRGETCHIIRVYQNVLKEADIFTSCLPELKWSIPCCLPKPFAVLITRAQFEHHGKNWPLDRFKALALLFQKKGVTPVVIGSKQDLVPLKSLREMRGNIDLVGQTPLHTLGGTFHEASIVVGVDTGITHMAAIVGAPTIALYGPEVRLETWHLYGAKASWINKESLCDITVEDVWGMCEASHEAISEKSKEYPEYPYFDNPA